MNIFLFNEAAWDDSNSFGNTVSNFFCGDVWKNDSFSNFYCRTKAPNNKMQVEYYNLSAIDIIKGIAFLNKCGRHFTTDTISEQSDFFGDKSEKEKKNIDRIHKGSNEIIYFAHELIWLSRVWINKHFKNFVNEVKPDVLFAFATNPYVLWPLVKYLRKNFGTKVVLLIADDTYNSFSNTSWFRRIYLKKQITNCILFADKLYAISDEMSELYKNRFNKDVSTLYKGCDLSLSLKDTLNKPLRLIYAGNLFWGRSKTLSLIASALEKINRDEHKAQLEIYTGSTIEPQIDKMLNLGISSRIMGERPYEEIKKLMHDADIVLHVESFEEKSIETVRYSFSTKIIDCLQSGSQVVGIGPNDIASISYLRKVNGAIVIDDPCKIEETLQELILDSDSILDRTLMTREFALAHHEKDKVQKKLRFDLEQLIS